jgi:hypothetical protein
VARRAVLKERCLDATGVSFEVGLAWLGTRGRARKTSRPRGFGILHPSRAMVDHALPLSRYGSTRHLDMSHGVRCGLTMFTKQVSRPLDSPDPSRGRGGGAGRANSKEDLVTRPIRGFCALQVHSPSWLPRGAGRAISKKDLVSGPIRDLCALQGLGSADLAASRVGSFPVVSRALAAPMRPHGSCM